MRSPPPDASTLGVAAGRKALRRGRTSELLGAPSAATCLGGAPESTSGTPQTEGVAAFSLGLQVSSSTSLRGRAAAADGSRASGRVLGARSEDGVALYTFQKEACASSSALEHLDFSLRPCRPLSGARAPMTIGVASSTERMQTLTEKAEQHSTGAFIVHNNINTNNTNNSKLLMLNLRPSRR